MNTNRHHLRLSVPTRSARLFPPFATPTPTSSSTPSSLSTPSKLRPSSSSSSSLSSLLLLLFSLRSLYSLLPFLRSAPPSFSLFPFSFLVSLVSFLLLVSLLPFSSSSSSPSPTPSSLRPHLRFLLSKSLLLSLVLLLRFHSLRFCGAGAAILADLSGSLLASSLSSPRRRLRSLPFLFSALLLLSFGWDRIGCFPFSSSSPPPPPPPEGCARVASMLLPFGSGFLGFFEHAASNWGSLRQLGRRRVRIYSLGLATAFLFVPAATSFLFQKEFDDGALSISNFGWPLVNTVIFGVILNESYVDEKRVVNSRDFRRDYVVTFFCTLVLELFYFPKLSLPGFILCGFLLWFGVRELGSSSLNYVELGSSDHSKSLYFVIMGPIRHILSERKSRKIAAFLLINTAYMVVEFVAGFMSNSLGLISDACHMLFDCAALAIGLYASYISRLPANSQFNYGRGRFEVLSGYVNAVLLVLVGALIVLESFERILDPQEISTNSLLVVSIGGLVVNMVGLVFFHEEHHHAHGGGTCSHSHAHSHSSHSHHHHHHHEHTHENASVKECSGDHENVKLLHESPDGQSHDGHDCHSCNHDNYHYDLHGEHDQHKHINEHGCHKHSHEHDHHKHSHEHDHHKHNDKLIHDHNNHQHNQDDHSHVAEVHIHHEPNSTNSEHQLLHISSSLHSHCPEGHIHHKEQVSFSKVPNYACNNSSCSEEASAMGKPPNSSRKHHPVDHNMEGIFLHVLADTMGSVGVVISTLLIKYKGWLVSDPVCSVFISIMIISSVVPLLRNSAEILLQRVPRAHEQDLKVALDDIMRIKGVCGIHNMHAWNFTNTNIVGTFHLHVSEETDKASALQRATELLHEAGIEDLTIQVECIKG